MAGICSWYDFVNSTITSTMWHCTHNAGRYRGLAIQSTIKYPYFLKATN